MHVRSALYFYGEGTEDCICRDRHTTMTTIRAKTGQFARVATNLAIGVVGLVIVRLIVQGLPMFQEAGWIVSGKLKVTSGAVIVVDALLLSVLVRFAIELRAYLVARFIDVPGLGAMAASLAFLIATAIAFTDFKPVTLARPSTKQLYLWSFFTLAAALLVQIVYLLYRDRDRIAALVLGQPMPVTAGTGDSMAASAGG